MLYKQHMKLFFPHIFKAACWFSRCSPIQKCRSYLPVHKSWINKFVYFGHVFICTHLFCTWWCLLHLYNLVSENEKGIEHLYISLTGVSHAQRGLDYDTLKTRIVCIWCLLWMNSSAQVSCRLGLCCLPIFKSTVILKGKIHGSFDQFVEAFLLI